MPAPLQKLEGVVEHLIYENRETGYSVFEVRSGDSYVVVAGTVGEVCIGQKVEAYGQMEVHPNHGEQFKAQSCNVMLPEQKEGILAYLSSGALPYVGPATAKKLVSLFGDETLEVIAQEPMKLTQIKGITEQKAQAISNEFRRMFGVQEVVAWLGRYQIPPVKAVEVFRYYGPHTLQMLTDNPYLLCGEPLNLKFSVVDIIAAEQKIQPEDTLRVTAGALYALRYNANQGHTCVPRQRLVESTASFIRLEPEQVDRSVEAMLETQELSRKEFDGTEYLFLPDLLRAEEDIASILAQRSQYPPLPSRGIENKIRILEQTQNLKYAPLQKEAIIKAMENRVFVLTGGPGTGKTTVLNGVLALCQEQGEQVALCAPTGRAAKRLSEITECKATTIHRLLEVDYSSGVVRFIHNSQNLLKQSVVILDEMSMVDVKLFQALLLALRPSCRVIMVGDSEQLPSVGPGNLLGEIIQSGVVPVVRLTEIFRQAEKSLIVRNARRISQGEMIAAGDKSDDFFLMERTGISCAETICQLVCQRLPAAYGYDPVQDIQVLTPTKTGWGGTIELNKELQRLLNPPDRNKPEIQWGDRFFRLGDKVMQVRNNYDLIYEREDGEPGAGVFNGDIGIIVRVDPQEQTLLVKMDDRLVAYGKDVLGDLEMAYAITVHKSQGNEFPAVVLAAGDPPRKLCYRNLLYTGVTRARKLCVVVGSKRVVEQMIQNTRQAKRYSCLSRLLREELE